jgi:hypothetical protein
MRHEAPLPSVPRAPVSEVAYHAVAHLRLAWHAENFPPEADPAG